MKNFFEKSNQKVGSVLSVLLILLYISMLFAYSEESALGVEKALKLSADVLVPSLFPFMAACSFLCLSGALMRENKLYAFLSEKLFSLSKNAFPVFIISLIGGYPVGAGCVDTLYKKGSISQYEASECLKFSVNPSPSFVIMSVGAGMLKSTKAGALMYSSIVLSSLTVGIVTRLFRKSTQEKNVTVNGSSPYSFSSAFVGAVKDSTLSIIYICAFVVLFFSLSEMLCSVPLNSQLKMFLRCILEVTNGALLVSEKFSLPHLTALLSFGGLCTLFQVVNAVSHMGISFLSLLPYRVISAFLGYFYCTLLMKIFPFAAETVRMGSFQRTAGSSDSITVSFCLILMCAVFILGDTTLFQKGLTEDKSESTIA